MFFFFLHSNGIINQMTHFFTCWMFRKVVCSSSNKVRVRNNNYHNYKSISSICGKKNKDFVAAFLLLLFSLWCVNLRFLAQ